MNYYPILATCAWKSCKENQCLTEYNDNGKLKYLPKCDKHKFFIEKGHQLYKKTGTIYQDFSDKVLTFEQKKEFLRLNINILMFEIKQRIEFTNHIKQIYRDEGHSHFVNQLITQVKSIIDQLEDLSFKS